MPVDWIGMDWIGLDWIGLEWIGLDWNGMDWIGLDSYFNWGSLQKCNVIGDNKYMHAQTLLNIPTCSITHKDTHTHTCMHACTARRC